ncbi:MAG TPA: histidine phosphatase family protein [Candidatus Dormibacteraeota bacterium]|nr:histidine phosphatase family protein [Candidatus Dormibacteraeota bacterium]
MRDQDQQSDRALRLFFVRHGESEANLLHVFSNRELPHGLTEHGRRQVALLAEHLESFPITKIFCSPVLRAVQSAELLSQQLNVGLEVVEALREYDVGSFEGSNDAANWASYEEVMRAWLLDGDSRLRTGGGESLEEIQERFGSFVFGLPEAFPNGGDVVLLAHGGLFRCALPHVLTNVSPRYSFANVLDHVSWVMAEAEGAAFVCREWNGRRVQPGAGL